MPLLIMPMVVLEFDYLFMRGRSRYTAAQVLPDLNASFSLKLCDQSFSAVAAGVVEIGWTTDPFDRIIVAQSLISAKSILVTAYRKIRIHYPRAVW